MVKKNIKENIDIYVITEPSQNKGWGKNENEVVDKLFENIKEKYITYGTIRININKKKENYKKDIEEHISTKGTQDTRIQLHGFCRTKTTKEKLKKWTKECMNPENLIHLDEECVLTILIVGNTDNCITQEAINKITNQHNNT